MIMEKKKAVLKIRSFSPKDGMFLLEAEDFGARTAIKDVVSLCEKKHGGFIQLEMSPPYRKRTTGELSQNNLVWRLITIIAQETGNELEDIEIAAKERAIKRGYPSRLNKLTGKPVPASMSSINTVEAGYLIDELYAIAGEFGIDIDE